MFLINSPIKLPVALKKIKTKVTSNADQFVPFVFLLIIIIIILLQHFCKLLQQFYQLLYMGRGVFFC